MAYNTMNEYIKITKNRILMYMKEILGNKFRKKISEKYVDSYINIRYYNINNKDTKIRTQILDELDNQKRILLKNATKEETKIVEDTYIFYKYIANLDDIIYTENTEKTINRICELREKKLNKKEDDFKEKFEKIVKETKKETQNLLLKIESKYFYLKITNYEGIQNVERINLKYNIEFPAIYSNSVIEKAFHTNIIDEDRLFVEYNLIIKQVINDIRKGNFKKQYILEFSDMLIKKKQKTTRLMTILSNPAVQDKVSIKIKYKTFYENKDFVQQLMRNGYKISIIIDEKFNGTLREIESLNMFKYILVDKESEYYDQIKKNGQIIKKIIEI